METNSTLTICPIQLKPWLSCLSDSALQSILRMSIFRRQTYSELVNEILPIRRASLACPQKTVMRILGIINGFTLDQERNAVQFSCRWKKKSPISTQKTSNIGAIGSSKQWLLRYLYRTHIAPHSVICKWYINNIECIRRLHFRRAFWIGLKNWWTIHFSPSDWPTRPPFPAPSPLLTGQFTTCKQ